MNIKTIFVLVLVSFIAVVVIAALTSSVPLYLIGATGAITTYLVGCVCTDLHNLGR